MGCDHNDLYTCQDCEMSAMSARNADLERQLAEANANEASLKMEIEAANSAADYQSRLVAEAKAEIDRLRAATESHSEDVRKLQAVIAMMRPMIEACKARYERHALFDGMKGVPCQCLTCQWYRDYEARKKP